jgi:hypothetical protein
LAEAQKEAENWRVRFEAASKELKECKTKLDDRDHKSLILERKLERKKHGDTVTATVENAGMQTEDPAKMGKSKTSPAISKV